MTREEKSAVIEELKEKFQSNQHFYLADTSGMTVADINAFRRMCYNKGLDYKVYKNTLIKKALEGSDGDFEPLNDALKGFSGIIFSQEVSNLPAKVIKDFRKKVGGERPSLKAASIELEFFIGEENLKTLSELKSKNELIGEIVTILQSPAKNVISALKSSGGTIAGLVKTLADREN